MARSSLFENACTLLKLTEAQKDHLRFLNAALCLNDEDGVHIYMVIGEVVSKALDNHRLLTTTFLADFERTAKGSEARTRAVLADAAELNANANAALVGAAIERKMQEVAQKQRRKVSLSYAALFLITLFFMTCAGWALGDITMASSSSFWRDMQNRGEAAQIQEMISWNPSLLKTWASCSPGHERYGTHNGRGFCGFGIFADPDPGQKISNVESIATTTIPYIRSTLPWAVPLFAFSLGILTISIWHRWRLPTPKLLRPTGVLRKK